MPVLEDGRTVRVRRPGNPPVRVVRRPATPSRAVVVRGAKGDPGDGTVELQAHIDDTTPHPAYDDQPDLVLIFNNGLV